MQHAILGLIREAKSREDTRLIYRGFAHEPSTVAKPSVQQLMVYRGVVHDGMHRESSVAPRSELVYRGVRHVR